MNKSVSSTNTELNFPIILIQMDRSLSIKCTSLYCVAKYSKDWRLSLFKCNRFWEKLSCSLIFLHSEIPTFLFRCKYSCKKYPEFKNFIWDWYVFTSLSELFWNLSMTIFSNKYKTFYQIAWLIFWKIMDKDYVISEPLLE